ncbi:MAG: outer membrane protein assembly factor BamD [Flavobacteriales bacterium]|nr:outer membrane protein assembly factor BamD [Flavobacteriales bacterium]
MRKFKIKPGSRLKSSRSFLTISIELQRFFRLMEGLNTKISFLACIFLLSLFTGCSEYQKLIKSSDYALKYEKAKEYYNKKKYSKALTLFEELLTIYRGTTKAEEIYYYYAYSHYGVGDYILANHFFSTYSSIYPMSSRVEECDFMAAYCHYLDSPRDVLEQSNTLLAISELQSFVNRYPQSTRVARCNELIEELRKKLENKAYRNAMQYYNMEKYNSASVAFANVLKEFPDTDRRFELYYMIVKSNYMYGKLSVRSKKKERLQLAKDNYIKFADKLASSKYAKPAQEILEKVEAELKYLENEEKRLKEEKLRSKQ